MLVDDKKSSTGYIVSLGTGAFTWLSKNQHAVSLSSTETKYRMSLSASCEAAWLSTFDYLQVIQDDPSTMSCDNHGLLKLTKNLVFYDWKSMWKYISISFDGGE